MKLYRYIISELSTYCNRFRIYCCIKSSRFWGEMGQKRKKRKSDWRTNDFMRLKKLLFFLYPVVF